ncbi:MAG TPA: lysophospholipid acyltransferase family protein [Thermoanaerobaculia bacterium]
MVRVLLGLAKLGRRIPLRAGRAFGRALGTLAWHVVRRERRKALRNLAIAFPDWSETQRERTIRAMFRHLGMSLFEVLWLPNFNAAQRERTTIVEGIEPLLKLIDEGRTVMAFTGHCGNWEWLATTVASYGRPLTAMQRERDETEVNELITSIRASAGIRTVDRGSAAAGRDMIQALRKPGMMAFLIDQNIRTESVKVPFFGIPALTPIGPGKLAVRMELVCASMFIERRPDGIQHVRVNPPFAVTRNDDPVEVTARLTREIEDQVRRVPEQWVWMHDRWRERKG